MIGFTAEALVDLRRWAICGAIVVLTHAGIAAAMVGWGDPDAAAEPAAAIVIEFAPVPVAPAMPQMEILPGPEQVMSDASPNKPTESLEEKIEEKVEQKVEARLEQKIEEKVDSKPVEEPPPEVAPAPDPEVAIQPPPPQEVKLETPKRQEPRPPAPTTSAPQAIPEQTAAIPAAPTQGQITPQNSPATVKWKGQVVALIERNKHYPETSARRGERGVAQVFFSLDRRGRVLESRVVRSSGASALDEEALALLRRAQPFPPPPPEFPGDSVTLILPLRFAK
jgi:periplasmic protein TonB